MENSKNKKRILTTSIVCCVYLVLTIFYYHIDKYTSGIICFLLTVFIPITFIALIVFFINGIIWIFKNRKNLTIRIFIPFIICAITLTYTIFSPYRLNSEYLEHKGEVVIRACYEGTQNQATLKFWEDQTFELHWTGVFFYSSWTYGTYEQRADTLFLHYTTEKPYRFGDSIVIKDDLLITINQHKIDSSQYFVPFYLGYCKGLN